MESLIIYVQLRVKRLVKVKLKFFCSPNVSTTMAHAISNSIGFSKTDNLGKYLGTPLLHSRVNKKTYYLILEHVEQRLSGWSAKHLSFAGRVTLAKSVI